MALLPSKQQLSSWADNCVAWVIDRHHLRSLRRFARDCPNQPALRQLIALLEPRDEQAVQVLKLLPELDQLRNSIAPDHPDADLRQLMRVADATWQLRRFNFDQGPLRQFELNIKQQVVHQILTQLQDLVGTASQTVRLARDHPAQIKGRVMSEIDHALLSGIIASGAPIEIDFAQPGLTIWFAPENSQRIPFRYSAWLTLANL